MKSKKWTTGLLIVYLACLTWIILFKMGVSVNDMPHMRSMNLIPFGQSVITNGRVDYGEMMQNAFAFLPYGLLMGALWEEKPFWIKWLPVVLTSLVYEVLQYILAVGATDITDLIMNSLGGAIGIAIAFLLSRILKNHWKTLIHIVCLIGAVALGLLLVLLLALN